MYFRNILELFFIFIFFLNCCAEGLEEGCYDTRIVGTSSEETKLIPATGKGFLYSPGFEENKNYPDYVRCSYQLVTYEGQHIRIQFNLLDLDLTDGCGADSLSIFNVDASGKMVLVGKHCGNQTPLDYVSDSSTMVLTLQTDGFVRRRGFNITYTPQKTRSLCPFLKKQCRNRNCVDFGVFCDGYDDCGDGSDEEKCPGTILPYSECGKPEIDPVTFSDFDRIVGGREAVHGSWPWMADLQRNGVEPSNHFCGGVLINAQWVLTAAHCFTESKLRHPSGVRVIIGNYHKFKKDPSEQVRYAERIVIYYDIPNDEFQKNGKYDDEHDMALIKLNAPVKFTKYVKPICLGDYSINLATSNCYATGWGVTRGSGGSHLLKQAYHPVQPDTVCTYLLRDHFKPSTMICAGSMTPLNSVCSGDSGGPLVCETSKGKWSIVGVASFVISEKGASETVCGLSGRPSVFSRVSVKFNWINTMIYRYS